jgi:hypothetical protein
MDGCCCCLGLRARLLRRGHVRTCPFVSSQRGQGGGTANLPLLPLSSSASLLGAGLPQAICVCCCRCCCQASLLLVLPVLLVTARGCKGASVTPDRVPGMRMRDQEVCCCPQREKN